jgi:hypothetical protein
VRRRPPATKVRPACSRPALGRINQWKLHVRVPKLVGTTGGTQPGHNTRRTSHKQGYTQGKPPAQPPAQKNLQGHIKGRTQNTGKQSKREQGTTCTLRAAAHEHWQRWTDSQHSMHLQPTQSRLQPPAGYLEHRNGAPTGSYGSITAAQAQDTQACMSTHAHTITNLYRTHQVHPYRLCCHAGCVSLLTRSTRSSSSQALRRNG